MHTREYSGIRQAGFSLVEIMVALVIGLIVSAVIAQVMSVYGGQKRTTSGTSDAQTSGTLGLYSIQREVQLAGYGLPLFDTVNPPLKCNLADIAMVTITPGASDAITVRYGDSTVGGTPVIMRAGSTGNSATVDTSIGCAVGNDALVTKGNSCNLTKVTAVTVSSITMANANANVDTASSISCLGTWRTIRFSVNANQLLRSENGAAGVPIGSEIVSLKAQYGLSATPADNVVNAWSSAAPGDRNLIKAIRVAVVARSGLLEKVTVTNAAPVAWNAPGAPSIDLSGDANWQKYRYRVFETIIPLRNMVWSKETLK